MSSRQDETGSVTTDGTTPTHPGDSLTGKRPVPTNDIYGRNHSETLLRKRPVPTNDIFGRNHSETLVRR
jgi:hypothetical protein